MCVGSVAVIWLVDYWVLYGQPWLMPTHPQRPTHKITALPYQRSSSCCTAKYQDDHFRLTTDHKKSAFQRSTFCGCTDFLLDENFLCYLSSMLSWCCWCKRCSHSPSQKKNGKQNLSWETWIGAVRQCFGRTHLRWVGEGGLYADSAVVSASLTMLLKYQKTIGIL